MTGQGTVEHLRPPAGCMVMAAERHVTRTDDDRDRAFRDIVVPELDVLYRVALRLTRDPHEAEDVVQDTVIRAYRAIDRFDGRYPRAWLLTILRNTHRNRLRKRQPQLVWDADRTFGVLPAGGADGREGPAETVMAALPDPRITGALRALTPAHRAVVLLVDVDQLTYREAAEVLEVPLGTVMSRLHRARKRLRKLLERSGYVTRGDRR